MNYFTLCGTSILTFLATEIDDFIIFVILFGSQNSKKGKISVIFGQLLCLEIITFLCSFLAEFLNKIPQNYLRFLGFLPILIGLISIIKLIFKKNDDEESEENGKNAHGILSVFLIAFTTTISSSGDNLGIYIPFLLNKSIHEKLFVMIIFGLCQILWSTLQIQTSRIPIIQKIIEKAGKIISPVIFIGLGLLIFFDIG